MSLVTLTPPAYEPVVLSEVYDQLRLGVNLASHQDDTRLLRLIKAARERTETETRRALIQQQLQLVIDHSWRCDAIAFGSDHFGGQHWANNWGLNSWLARGYRIELQRPPLIEVVAVQFYDEQNVLRSVDIADYRVIASRQPAVIEFVDGFTFPQTFMRSDAWSITFTAGYPPGTDDDPQKAAAANVPETIKEAILLRVDQAYNARLPAEDMVIDARIESMLMTYQVARL